MNIHQIATFKDKDFYKSSQLFVSAIELYNKSAKIKHVLAANFSSLIPLLLQASSIFLLKFFYFACSKHVLGSQCLLIMIIFLWHVLPS